MTAMPALPWLEPDDAFPDPAQAWGAESEAPGLLAAGSALGIEQLKSAYSNGIFPWYSEGQPILWWSTDPRMVLRVPDFKLHRSLRKTLTKFSRDPNFEIRFNTSFFQVIRACASRKRSGQNGTWIVQPMVQAYCQLHQAGHAHSVETWMHGKLQGGLYCVALGRAVFGESMFAEVSDASKIALAALIAFCRAKDIGMIDCQQNTAHLASLGAAEISRSDFLTQVRSNRDLPSPEWRWDPLYWAQILDR